MIEGPGDRAARFRMLYDAAYPRVMAYALRRARSREDALDVVADTMLIAWRRFEDIPAGDRSLPWVLGVAHRVLANHYRTEGRRERLLARAAQEPLTTAPEFDLVHQALQELSDDHREILTLSAWDDLDNREIAAVLGLPPAAVAVRLHRARRRLARELGRLGLPAARGVISDAASRTLEGMYGTPPGSTERNEP